MNQLYCFLQVSCEGLAQQGAWNPKFFKHCKQERFSSTLQVKNNKMRRSNLPLEQYCSPDLVLPYTAGSGKVNLIPHRTTAEDGFHLSDILKKHSFTN